MAATEQTARMLVRRAATADVAILTTRSEVGDSLRDLVGANAVVNPAFDEISGWRGVSLYVVDLGSEPAAIRGALAARHGRGPAFVLLAENLRQVASLGPLPRDSSVVDISDGLVAPALLRIAGAVERSLRHGTPSGRHFVDVAFLAERGALLFVFDNGRRYSLPLAALSVADRTAVEQVTLLYQGSAVSVLQSSGNRFEVPWDFVLHVAEEDYEYHQSRPEVTRRRAETAHRVGARVRAERAKRHLTQQRLAELTGIKRPNIARLERGTHATSLATLERVAAALGVTVAELIAEQ
jgi:XRE family transcriptional regulator, regulator of sulfur utilization